MNVGSEHPGFVGSERPGSQVALQRRTDYGSYTVVEKSRSERAKPGDRIASMYGHRTAAVLGPSDLLIPVPADIPDAIALLRVLACETARAPTGSTTPKDPVLLTGAVALLALNRLGWWGARHVSVLELRPERQNLARALEASEVLTAEQLPQPQRFAFGLGCSSSS